MVESHSRPYHLKHALPNNYQSPNIILMKFPPIFTTFDVTHQK
jgi:hypothetical protein